MLPRMGATSWTSILWVMRHFWNLKMAACCVKARPYCSTLQTLAPLQLAPSYGSMEYYWRQDWLNFFTSEIHKGFIRMLHAYCFIAQ